jgi:hypothetical protein
VFQIKAVREISGPKRIEVNLPDFERKNVWIKTLINNVTDETEQERKKM